MNRDNVQKKKGGGIQASLRKWTTINCEQREREIYRKIRKEKQSV